MTQLCLRVWGNGGFPCWWARASCSGQDQAAPQISEGGRIPRLHGPQLRSPRVSHSSTRRQVRGGACAVCDAAVHPHPQGVRPKAPGDGGSVEPCDALSLPAHSMSGAPCSRCLWPSQASPRAAQPCSLAAKTPATFLWSPATRHTGDSAGDNGSPACRPLRWEPLRMYIFRFRS